MLIAKKREQIGGITAIPSAVNLLKNLPQHSWAVVTSADWGLAANRLEITGIPEAPMLIAEEDVARRKPNPDGFQLAAQNLGKSVTASIVFEDSPSGLPCTIAITNTLRATPPEPPEWTEGFRAVRIEYDGVTKELVLTVSSERPSAI